MYARNEPFAVCVGVWKGLAAAVLLIRVDSEGKR